MNDQAIKNEIPPYQQRVIDEKSDLDEKLAKLEAFAQTAVFAGLDVAERSRLTSQHSAMLSYSNILGDRIAAF